jgi:LacI family transcriptional regulator
VAAAAGVSIMTVSNVINNRPNVGESVRERVTRCIEELGYVPNRAGRELSGTPYTRIGLLYPGKRNAFIASVFVGSLTAAARVQADISIQLSDVSDEAGLRQGIRHLEDGGIEGLLLPSPIAELAAQAFRAQALEVPAVAVAPGYPIAGMSSVRCDEQRAAFELVSMLLDLGHTRIGHIAGPSSQSGSTARLQGYRDALSARGVQAQAAWLTHSPFVFQDGVTAARELLERQPRVTAVFAANDTLGAAVLTAAQQLGLRTPEQLSVVGYDDSPIAEQVWPGLTTVRQDSVAMTERAVEILNRQVLAWRTDATPQPIEDLVLPYEIVRRASVATVPVDVR